MAGERSGQGNQGELVSCCDLEFLYDFRVNMIAAEPVKERRFTVTEYHQLGEVGVIGPDERVELIHGKIFEMSPIGPTHAFLVRTLNQLFSAQLPQNCLLDSQSPIRLDQENEPEPDVAVLRGPGKRYRDRLPSAEDVLLLVEVADSSLKFDRTEKLALYADHAVPEVWIVNVIDRQIERYGEPVGGRFTASDNFGSGEVVAATKIEGLAVAVDDLSL